MCNAIRVALRCEKVGIGLLIVGQSVSENQFSFFAFLTVSVEVCIRVFIFNYLAELVFEKFVRFTDKISRMSRERAYLLTHRKRFLLVSSMTGDLYSAFSSYSFTADLFKSRLSPQQPWSLDYLLDSRSNCVSAFVVSSELHVNSSSVRFECDASSLS
jgi:hypothetical protein